VFETDQINALAMLFLETHTSGVLISQVFFGLHVLLLGYLLFRSNDIPGILGILMFLASLGYLIEIFGTLLAPQHGEVFAWIVAVPAIVAELSFTVWLLVKGGSLKDVEEMRPGTMPM